MLVHALLGGVIYGCYFTLIGLGLNLVFGVMRIVNLAHGDVLMLGAFAAFFLFHLVGLSPFIAAPVVMAGFFLLGLPFYHLVVPRLALAKDAEMLSLILFFGIQQIIEALAAIVFGSSERSIPGRVLGVGPFHFLGQTLSRAWVIGAAIAAGAVIALYLYLYHTRSGLLTRAVMASRDEALASGIDIHRISARAFAIGLALAGLAGVFAPFMLGSVTPAMGVSVNLAAFAVIIVGSLGNPLGTVAGGLIYGVGLLLMQTYLSAWADLLPNLLLIGVLLARPTGLLGRRVRLA